MKDFLQETFQRLLDHTDLTFKRYLYKHFQQHRLTGIVGPRGVGKTTLMLQYIKEHLADNQRTFYLSADSVYFQQTTLLELINDLYRLEGHRIFFIDEIHQYHNWQQELKNLYDAFPDVQIIYSGSSMLELTQGSYDLSRRTTIYHLAGLSFREYLNFYHQQTLSAVTWSQLLENPTSLNQLSTIPALLGHFKQYLASGYYPFAAQDSHSYYERIVRMINKIIFEDIPSYFDLKTQNLPIFRKILTYLSSIPPGQVNTNNIARHLNIAHQTMSYYLSILEQVGLIYMIYPLEGSNNYLRKPQKIFLHNTSLFYALQQCMGEQADPGNLRELYFTQALRDAGQTVYHSKQADFCTSDYTFEIGGKNKTAKQIANLNTPAYLVKDDVLVASQRSLPFYYMGLLY